MYKAHRVKLGKKHKSFNVHEGKLHRALGVPEGEKIGQKRMHAALHSDKPSIRKMARSGIGLSHMHH
jgi:hypothetical protein